VSEVGESADAGAQAGESAGPPSGVAEPSLLSQWRVPLVLIALTFGSTMWVGALMHEGADPLVRPLDLLRGWDFSLPLMAILLAHELGHYIAGRIHRVDVSPPYFVPMPPVFPLGTMGAVINIRGAIRDRNALLDVGAAGPIAGMVVALPVLAIGIATSPVERIHEAGTYAMEGRSIVYLALLWALKGPIPEGMDIFLSPTAFAGWAGLLVTMINLFPVGQLDGGHVAYALLGERQNRIARLFVASLPLLAIGTGLYYGDPYAGAQWIVWFVLLLVMARLAGWDHPPTGEGTLTAGRRAVAIGTLVLFVLLFMPSWLRAA
jgi:membrane-associated protease RseP (regulator of RpoE activity)